jgi:hypothetical protein
MKTENNIPNESKHRTEVRAVPIRWGLRSWKASIIQHEESAPDACNEGQIQVQRKAPARKLGHGTRTLSLINLNEALMGLDLPGLRSIISLVETPFKIQEQN